MKTQNCALLPAIAALSLFTVAERLPAATIITFDDPIILDEAGGWHGIH